MLLNFVHDYYSIMEYTFFTRHEGHCANYCVLNLLINQNPFNTLLWSLLEINTFLWFCHSIRQSSQQPEYHWGKVEFCPYVKNGFIYKAPIIPFPLITKPKQVNFWMTSHYIQIDHRNCFVLRRQLIWILKKNHFYSNCFFLSRYLVKNYIERKKSFKNNLDQKLKVSRIKSKCKVVHSFDKWILYILQKVCQNSPDFSYKS